MLNIKGNAIWKTLGNINFRKLWFGQLVSQIGDGLAMMAMMILANQLTNSTIAVAGVTIAMALPSLVFGLIAGVYVDRWDRKKIMIFSDLIRGVLLLTLVLVRDVKLLWLVYVVAILQASVGVFFEPAKSASIPQILSPDLLMTANAFSQATRLLANVLGMGLAGIIISATGSWLAFALDGVSFFISAAFIMWMIFEHKPAAPLEGEKKKATKQLGEGLSFIGNSKLLVSVMITYAVTMLGLGAVIVLVVPFLMNDLKVDAKWIGLVQLFEAVGMLIGSAIVATLSKKISARSFMLIGTMAMGGFIAVVNRVHSLTTVIYIILGVGVFLTAAQAAASTLVQRIVPNNTRGRVLGAMNVVYSVTSILSMATAGVLGDVIGIRNVFLLAGLILITAGLLGAYLMTGEKEPDQAG
jgi:MFS family permease